MDVETGEFKFRIASPFPSTDEVIIVNVGGCRALVEVEMKEIEAEMGFGIWPSLTPKLCEAPNGIFMLTMDFITSSAKASIFLSIGMDNKDKTTIIVISVALNGLPS